MKKYILWISCQILAWLPNMKIKSWMDSTTLYNSTCLYSIFHFPFHICLKFIKDLTQFVTIPYWVHNENLINLMIDLDVVKYHLFACASAKTTRSSKSLSTEPLFFCFWWLHWLLRLRQGCLPGLVWLQINNNFVFRVVA